MPRRITVTLFTLALLIGLALSGVDLFDTTHASISPRGGLDVKAEAMPALQGRPAVDYLKQKGLFDRVKASVEASRYGINKAGAGGFGPLFTEVKKLMAYDREPDGFGTSVAISGETIVVAGAYGGGVSYQEVAYVYERNQGGADNWGEVKKLTASDGAALDQFGESVGISGDTIVVGAYGDDSKQGSAYVYERNQGGGGNWGEIKKLTASDGAVDHFFGFSVGISGETIVIGAPLNHSNQGSAYVYQLNQGGGGNWGEVKELTALDGASDDFFGYSVGISGDAIVVGAVRDDSFQGSAWVFERNQGGTENWGQVTKLTASDGTADDQFGYSVAISADTIVVGARHDDSYQGSAYVFERNQGKGDNWGEVKKLTASDGAEDDQFGNSVWINGETIVVGAPLNDSHQGSAYVYVRNQGASDNWVEVKKLTASDGAADDFFGDSLGISDDTIIVGAPGSNSFTGAAYIFPVNIPPWILAAPVSLSAGGASSNSAIAIVKDPDQASDTLIVTVNGGARARANGVSVSNITVDSMGVVKADVAASCAATNVTFTLEVTDSRGGTATDTLHALVNDTTVPTLTLNPSIELRPPNGSYTAVTISQMVASVSDGCNTALSVKHVRIEKVTSDEPDDAPGNGNSINDIVIAANCQSVQLRAERDGAARNGRVYSITLRLRDASGNTTRQVFKVSVPASNNGVAAVEDAAAQTVTSSCP